MSHSARCAAEARLRGSSDAHTNAGDSTLRAIRQVETPARRSQSLRSRWICARSLVLRSLAALVVLTVVLGAAPGAGALVRCVGSQRVHAGSCCPERAVPAPVSISRTCCARIMTPALVGAAVRADAQPAPVVRALTVCAVDPFAPPTAFARAAETVRAPRAAFATSVEARAGPSLVVLHQRFLI